MSDDLINAQRIKAHRLALLLASMVALCLTLLPYRVHAQCPFPGASLMDDKTLALFDVQFETPSDFDRFYTLDHDQATLTAPQRLYESLPSSLQRELFQELQAQLESLGRLNNDEDATSLLVQDTIYRASNISDLAISPRRGRVVGYMSGAWASQDSQGDEDDYSGFDVSSWGGGLGQDWKFLEHCIWGYGLQAVQSKITPNSGNYNSKLDSFSGYARMSIFDAMWRFDVVIGATKSWQKQHYFQTDSYNRFTTSQWFLETEFGARFDKGYTRIEPLVNFRAINLSEPKKASVFLTSTSFNKDFIDASYRLKVGSRFSWETDMTLATVKPYLLATWSHEFGKREIYVLGDSSPCPIAYRYGAHRMARDKIDLGGGVAAALRDTLDLYAQYNVELAKEYVGYYVIAGFNKKF